VQGNMAKVLKNLALEKFENSTLEILNFELPNNLNSKISAYLSFITGKSPEGL
jgi:hypothetical protein